MATDSNNASPPQENFTSIDTSLKVILDALTEVPGIPNVDTQFDPEEPGSNVP